VSIMEERDVSLLISNAQCSHGKPNTAVLKVGGRRSLKLAPLKPLLMN
jgi:hypothetical protein